MTTLLEHHPGDLRPVRVARSAGVTVPPIRLLEPAEIAEMRRAGIAVRSALDAAARQCRPGATTAEVDAAAAEVLLRLDAEAIFLGHPPEPGSPMEASPFPATTCISVNEELVHGLPGPRVLRSGDLVTIDCGARIRGPLGPWCADAAVTVPIGPIDPDSRRLLDAVQSMLQEAMRLIRPGLLWSAIAARLQSIADDAGVTVVEEYVGHGIGRELHEPPEVPCSALSPGSRRDFTLRPGMALAIEPMAVLGSPRTVRRPDGWTIAVADGGRSAHVEETIAVTADGVEILTRPPSTAGAPAAPAGHTPHRLRPAGAACRPNVSAAGAPA